ncbi:MAG: radical SAM protein [Acidimicrobiaceae bacterium]|nr:radical SAM protein [Acidimicrobiaceae bacterium]MYF44327.1 radical SAM protein [Acidimicrobiaceae bacterium]MYJ35750.1 radical SAM protein [Acidimicrobiaceae bacterium]
MGRTYAIRTFGCQMNEHDSERIAGLLEDDGYQRASVLEEADVMVLNTCCIRENADNKLYGALGRLKAVKAKRPGALIAVAGCLAQKDRDLVRERAGHVDVVFGTHNVHRAAELIDHARRHGPVVEILTETVRDDVEAFPSALPVRREAAHSAWVTIQIGCDNSCTFCIVPAVRGPEISRPFGELVDEVRDLAASGVSEITLLGQNVNSYGRDLALSHRRSINGNGNGQAPSTGDDAWWCGEAWTADRRARPLFADLLRAAGEIDGIRRVRFTSPHPKDLRPETISAMADVPAVCEHLHLPLQSGSDAVLRAMRRGYTAERYLQRLRAAREAVDDLAVSTDIIVGFPGETEHDFEQTLEVAAEARYDSAFTFIFSPRPGTAAAEMGDRFVPHEVSVARYERLRRVIERSSRLANEARIGRIEEVVVEGPSKKDPAVTTGRTRRNTLVHFPSPAGPAPKPGTYARVEVTAAAANFLQGELASIEDPPSPTATQSALPARRLIPVAAV